ncbi:MAG: alpha/beta hydrolase [Bacteroidales bacterium]|nr:alpha/beta hydrolase [Bacteroidales bacterium]
MSQVAEEHIVVNGNCRLTVKIYPRPDSESVILLHGGPGVPDEMTEVREILAEKLQVITFDQRGIGMKDVDGLSFDMAAFISDINSIAGYFNLEVFHLLGHSWGGLYAQLYARDFPQRILSLFLCSPASGTGSQWEETEREVFQYNKERSTLAEWIGMGLNTAMGLLGNQQAYRRLFRQIIINYHKGYGVEPPDEKKLARINSRAGTKTRLAIKKHPPLGAFGKTPYPVIITYGQFDAYGKSRRWVINRFPGAQLEIIPGSGHTPWKHNLAEFKKVLLTFYR